jgi:hypothetical protein
MSLLAFNPSLNRGPHLPVVVAVIGFSLIYADKNFGIDSGPQIVRECVLILHVIIRQYAPLFQFVECADDLLKGAVDDSPCLKNLGFGFFQFKVSGSSILPPSFTVKGTYAIALHVKRAIGPILYECQLILSKDLQSV